MPSCSSGKLEIGLFIPEILRSQGGKLVIYISFSSRKIFHWFVIYVDQWPRVPYTVGNYYYKIVCFLSSFYENNISPIVNMNMPLTLESVLFHTMTWWPEFSKFLTMPLPMMPRPRNPNFMVLAWIFFSSKVSEMFCKSSGGASCSKEKYLINKSRYIKIALAVEWGIYWFSYTY